MMTENTPVFSDDELATLTVHATTRAGLMAERDRIQTALDAINRVLFDSMAARQCRRQQLPSGAVVQIVQNRPRSVIVKEKLVELGVSMKLIDEATVSNPVAPFVRVDQPKDGAVLPEGTATDAPATTTVQ